MPQCSTSAWIIRDDNVDFAPAMTSHNPTLEGSQFQQNRRTPCWTTTDGDLNKPKHISTQASNHTTLQAKAYNSIATSRILGQPQEQPPWMSLGATEHQPLPSPLKFSNASLIPALVTSPYNTIGHIDTVKIPRNSVS